MVGVRDVFRRLRGWVDLEQQSLEEAMLEAREHAHGDLLDVGCGDRPYEALFRPRVSKYIGVEREESLHGSVNSERPNADVLYDGDELPFPDGSFDTVLSTQVVEHVPDPQTFFRELARVLRPDGTLIVTAPFSYRVHSEPYDYHRFTKYALQRYAEKNGVRVDVLRPRGGMWTVIGQKLTAHIALRFARLGGEAQRFGALTYERPMPTRPRYWTLPVALPSIVGVTATARLLDRIDPSDEDTLGYLLIGTKRREA